MTRTRTGWSPALLAALVPAVAPGLLAAQDARISTDVDTTLVTVGDRIRLTVRVEHDADARLVLPDSVDLSPFEVLGAEVLPTTTEGGRVRAGVVLTLTVFELGELEIPSFEVRVLGPGDRAQILTTDRYGVEVVSVGSDEGGDIRDIRGPLAIPLGYVSLGMLLLVLVALLVVTAWLVRRWRRREAPEGVPVPAKLLRPAHEMALEALARVEASPLLERGLVKEYHIEISEILRTYVERRYSVRALEMTTREVSWGLEAAGVAPDFREGLGSFLDRCDLVKFAKVRPGDDASRGTLELGRDLVRSSAPAVGPAREDPSRTTSPSGSATSDLEVTT
jgi:hypothetical protein